MNPMPAEPAQGRTAQKRQAILVEATTLFLRKGYGDTRMDEIAQAAGVSKQTVYKQFTDKEQLFRVIVEGVTRNSDAIVGQITAAFGAAPVGALDQLEATLRKVARVYLDAVLEPQVLSLRRLIIAEAERFPDLAESYYDQAPARGVSLIAECLKPYEASGLLASDELSLAAAQFAHLALSIAQDRAMFMPAQLPSPRDRDRLAKSAARMIIKTYGASGS